MNPVNNHVGTYKPIVAVIGRPNVGKSTLFNKLIGRRLSIVEDTPGVTRDRIYADCEWRGRSFMLVDTGGVEPFSTDEIRAQMRRQALAAIDSAQAVIFIVDIKDGVTSTDIEVSDILKKSAKPIVLCVNKCDSIGENPVGFYEFYNLGLGDPIAVSAAHGNGTGDLLDEVLNKLGDIFEQEYDTEHIKVAVVGKPNVGKSSLVNFIAGDQRMIVSETAGTTRDAADTFVNNPHGNYIFIDTAGIRRKSKINEKIEHYSVLRAHMAVDRSDVCLIMLDALEGYTDQDSKIAGYVHEQGKSSVIVVNKWDALEKDDHTMSEYKKKLQSDFSFMSYAPFMFISAATGQRVDKLFEMINFIYEQGCRRITTGMLNDLLAVCTARVQPPTKKGKRLKLYYITQSSASPPTFVIFCNDKELFHFSYKRYIENQIRRMFNLTGTPIRLIVRERGK
ncbi:MAG: ribosome biogenesis GTPase Der [Oscillospiraceae bacterium]|nr:ribosome biogenesis GTPase Der [Oscillospiraceae bacterium]